jgi:hypothetical protein
MIELRPDSHSVRALTSNSCPLYMHIRGPWNVSSSLIITNTAI